jgi:hypothetical protein
MTTGFKNSSGVDFDALFDPYVQGTKPANTGFATSDGVDLANRYAPLSYGSAVPATGFKIASGADVNTLWAAAGTAVYQTIAAFIATLSVTIPNGWVGIANTQYKFILNADGTGSKGRGPTLPAQTFNWTSDGNPPLKNYQVRLSSFVTDTANGAWVFTDNTAGAWVALDSTHGATIGTLKFVPSTNGGQGDYEGHGTLEIRDATTLAVVATKTFTVTGTAQNA